jgi:hypothetical protein
MCGGVLKTTNPETIILWRHWPTRETKLRANPSTVRLHNPTSICFKSSRLWVRSCKRLSLGQGLSGVASMFPACPLRTRPPPAVRGPVLPVPCMRHLSLAIGRTRCLKESWLRTWGRNPVIRREIHADKVALNHASFMDWLSTYDCAEPICQKGHDQACCDSKSRQRGCNSISTIASAHSTCVGEFALSEVERRDRQVIGLLVVDSAHETPRQRGLEITSACCLNLAK